MRSQKNASLLTFLYLPHLIIIVIFLFLFFVSENLSLRFWYLSQSERPLDLKILFASSLPLHNKREFMAHFAKGLERKAFIKQPKREWSLESPGRRNRS